MPKPYTKPPPKILNYSHLNFTTLCLSDVGVALIFAMLSKRGAKQNGQDVQA